MNTESYEKYVLLTQNAGRQLGDGPVVAYDGMLDLVANGDDREAALKFVVRHADPDDLCARARALASSQSTSDDVTIVAISRDLPR